MFDSWFSGSGPDESGLGPDLDSAIGSGLGSGLSYESSFGSRSELDFGSAWGSGKVQNFAHDYKRQMYSQRSVC